MIYLIDDTPQSQISTFLNLADYSDILDRREDLSLEDADYLMDADCILIHTSYHNRSVLNKIRETVCDFGDNVPLVMFSDSDLPEPVFDGENRNFIETFKKNVMYSMLPGFLQYYRGSGKADLNVLAYGEQWIRKEVNTMASKLLSKIMFLKGDSPLDKDDIDAESLMTILNLSQPEIGVTLYDILEDAQTVKEFRENINAITESFNTYGKNVYHWK